MMSAMYDILIAIITRLAFLSTSFSTPKLYEPKLTQVPKHATSPRKSC
jgi:hypothetical protein